MRDVKELCAIVEDEIGKIADKGLTTGNLETAYKLIDIYKDIKSTEYWDKKGEYYEEMLSQMQDGGYSESMSGNGGSYASGNSGNGGSYNSGRSRHSGGRYSRDGGSGNLGNSGNSYEGGNSGRRSHYVRGHYSRSSGGGDPYDDYMSEKQSYRSSGKNEDCKQRMLAALEEHMDELTDEIKTMSADADCGEERQVLSRYIQKLQKMM